MQLLNAVLTNGKSCPFRFLTINRDHSPRLQGAAFALRWQIGETPHTECVEMNRILCSIGAVATVTTSKFAHAQSMVTCPSSSATPYVRPVSGGPAIDVYSFLSVGDSVNLRADGVTGIQ